MTKIAGLREEYRRAVLDESHIVADAIEQFSSWYSQALSAELKEPTAMALATATRDGRPSVRMVLLKGFDERGFLFFTNYDSRKGREFAQNPRAALCFYWAELERQVRIEGEVAPTSRGESVGYFNSRPPGSRIGAAASPQSKVIGSRDELELAAAALSREYPDGSVPAPENWGGYRLKPDSLEFWQGRENRLHDRIRYRRDGERWIIERLAP